MDTHDRSGAFDRRGLEPGVQRQRIAAALRRARADARITQTDVAKAMDWSTATVIRVEAGTHRIRRVDLEELLRLYEVSEQLKAVLLELHEDSRRESPYAAFGAAADVPYLIFLQYELSAYTVRNFEPLLVPGLLQTEEYAHAVLDALEFKSPGKVGPLVDLRMTRQELLTGRENPPPPEMHFIIDEGVIRRHVGGPQVMRRQLERLKAHAQHNPQVTIQIVSREHGLYRLCRLPYVLLELPGVEYDEEITGDFQELVLYVEEPLSQLIIHEDAPQGRTDLPTPPEYLQAFMEIAADIATSAEETVAMLDDAIEDVSSTLANPPNPASAEKPQKRPRRDPG